MYIQRLDHSTSRLRTVTVRHDQRPQNHNIWHYHEELEFIYIKKGKGTFFVGDCIQPFSDGFIVLIGSNTPHYWLFDDVYVKEEFACPADIHVVHFKTDFCGSSLLELPESQALRRLYQGAQRAISLNSTLPGLKLFFENLAQQSPLTRISYLLHTLSLLSDLPAPTTLVSDAYANPQQQEDQRRMNKIFEHIRLHYKKKMQLDEVAQLAGLTTNSFCRYFKQKTGKTFVQFVNEFRINQACKQLAETDATIKEICFDCGFQNFVSFHKIFKSIASTTPSLFRDKAIHHLL